MAAIPRVASQEELDLIADSNVTATFAIAVA